MKTISSVLKITEIRQAVRNENRVNVYVNEKYAFSLDVQQVVDLGVKVRKIITAAELAEYKKASAFGKEYQRALEWVLVRPRSERELKDYLRRREIQGEAKERRQDWQRDREMAEMVARGEDTTKLEKRNARIRENLAKQEKYDFKELIATRLKERGYVDDRKFAEYFVENRLVNRGVSGRRLIMELKKKGVADSVIEEVMGKTERSDEAEMRKIIAKKRAKYDDEKLIQYLCRQGFAYEMARELVLASGTD